jgi:superfamily II DNA helicase RecQ
LENENVKGNSGPNPENVSCENVKVINITEADQTKDPGELIVKFSNGNQIHISKLQYNAIIEYGPITHDSLSMNVLQCVFDLGGNFGRTTIARILTGTVSKKLLTLNVAKLGTYGTARDSDMKEVLSLMDWLIQEDYLAYQEDSEFPVLICTCKGLDVIAGGE